MSLYSTRASKVWEQPILNDLYEVSSGVETATRAWLFHLKEGLTSALFGTWRVLASSAKVGGITWTADTSDLWTERDEVSTGAYGFDHAWIVMESPSARYGPFYMILDYVHDTDVYRATITFTKSKPTLTGLLTTARPVATGDEWSHTDVIAHVDSANQNHRGNLFVADDGSFVWAVQIKDLGIFTTVLLFNVMTRGSLRADDSVGAASLHWSDRTTQLAQTDTFRLRMLHPTDGTEVDAAAASLGYGASSRVVSTMSTDMALNTWGALPVDLFVVTGGKQALRGQLEDIWWAPEQLVDATPSSAGNLMQATVVGPFWLPTAEPILKP